MRYALLTILLVLSACGGGGGGSTAPPVNNDNNNDDSNDAPMQDNFSSGVARFQDATNALGLAYQVTQIEQGELGSFSGGVALG